MTEIVEPAAPGLSIAPGVTLPTDTITAKTAILGISGSGKTHSASVVAEEMLAAKMHAVVFDPLGVWWGLASVPEGETAVDGTPLYIFGGDHADVPLDPASGVATADLIVQDGLSVVLDMSGFDDDAQMATFVAAFSTRLLKINKEPLHVFIDEADLFVPETFGSKEEAASRKAVDNMVRRGRKGGIGTTLISQRPAVVAKNVLSQCTTLIVHQLTGAADQNAMAKWFGDHGTTAEQKEVTGSLSSLGRGEAWIFTPGLQQLVRATMRKRRTFDSSATPKFGERAVVPKRLAAPDLADLRERFALQVEAAKENDVDVLKAKNKKLIEENAQLKARPATGPEKIVTVKERVEVPVFKAGEAERLRETADDLLAMAEQVSALAALGKDLRTVAEEVKAAVAKSEAAQTAQSKTKSETKTDVAPAPQMPPTQKPAPKAPAKTAVKPTGGRLTGPQQKIVNAIAAFEALGRSPVERILVGVWSEYSATSSTFQNYMRELRNNGLVVWNDKDTVSLTPAGAAAVDGALPNLTSIPVLHAAWYERLTGPQKKLLTELVAVYPKPMTRTALADATGYSATSSTFQNYMRELRKMRVAEWSGSDGIRATELMFPEQLVAKG